MRHFRRILVWVLTSYLFMGFGMTATLIRFIFNPSTWNLLAFTLWTSSIIQEVEDRQGPSMGPWF